MYIWQIRNGTVEQKILKLQKPRGEHEGGPGPQEVLTVGNFRLHLGSKDEKLELSSFLNFDFGKFEILKF